MLQFFLNGGVPMLGVVVCGLGALVAAVRFAITPDGRKIGAIVSLSLATLATSLLGMIADAATVFHAVATNPEFQKAGEMPLILLQGLGESASPPILGFALLTVIWLVMAVGYRRLAPRLPM